MKDTAAPLRILMVESSPIMANLLLRLLREEPDVGDVGMVDTAAALADIESRAPDLPILDLALREGTGFDVLEGLQGPHGRRPAAWC